MAGRELSEARDGNREAINTLPLDRPPHSTWTQAGHCQDFTSLARNGDYLCTAVFNSEQLIERSQ